MEQSKWQREREKKRVKTTTYLVRFVHHAATVWHSQQVDVVVFTAFGKFIRLNIFQTDNRLGHDTPMPITAHTLLTCNGMQHKNSFCPLAQQHFVHTPIHIIMGVNCKGTPQAIALCENRFSSANWFIRVNQCAAKETTHSDRQRTKKEKSFELEKKRREWWKTYGYHRDSFRHCGRSCEPSCRRANVVRTHWYRHLCRPLSLYKLSLVKQRLLRHRQTFHH